MPIRGGDNADANTLQGLIPGLPKQVAEELAAVAARAVAFRRGETIVDRDSAVVPGVSYDDGMRLANRIHSSGQAVVWSGLREQAELYWEQLREHGLTLSPLEQG